MAISEFSNERYEKVRKQLQNAWHKFEKDGYRFEYFRTQTINELGQEIIPYLDKFKNELYGKSSPEKRPEKSSKTKRILWGAFLIAVGSFCVSYFILELGVPRRTLNVNTLAILVSVSIFLFILGGVVLSKGIKEYFEKEK